MTPSSQDSNNSLPNTSHMFRVSKVELDASGDLPGRVLLFITGNWPDSVKGDFSIALDDLKQMKSNIDRGVGFPTEGTSTGLAIDFKHEYLDEAAAWIKGLELEADEATGQGKLYASPVEWTDAGKEAVQGGRFKYISPSGYFGRKSGRLSMWANPTNLKEKAANVLDGAGLTNFPFLRGMSPIRAHATMVEWAREFGAAIYIHEADQRWVMRPDERISYWTGETLSLLDGVTLVRLGGHFPGSAVLHWRDGADGKGILCTGDTIQVVADRSWVSFMSSFPNIIPLPAAEVERIRDTIKAYTFERLYGGWFDRIIAADAHNAVLRSADRYIQAVQRRLEP